LEHNEQTQGSEAFGAYLRKLREGRRLSLDAVEELSSGFPEKVTKSHLSRIENGLALPTFPRLMAMSHIYGVPIASMAERYEMELRKGLGQAQLGTDTDEAILLKVRDFRLTGRYGDALVLLSALLDERHGGLHASQGGDTSETSLNLRLQVASCLIQLGRFEVAKEISEVALSARHLPQALRLIAIEQMAVCCYRLGRFTVALMALDQIDQELRAGEAPDGTTADILTVRGNVLLAMGDADKAFPYFERARGLYRRIPNEFSACKAGILMAEALIESDRLTDAESLLFSEGAVAEKHGFDRLKAQATSHLCLIAYRRKDFDSAEGHAIRSNTLARAIDYMLLVFRNSYYLWEIARARKDNAAMKLNERALRTYLGRLESHLPEADSFRAYLERGER
jgi:transcriptional regulator with XRE-family HTH domain